MVEAAGIEPASQSPSVEASTHVADLLCLAGSPPVGGMLPGQPVMPGFAGFPAGDVAAPARVHLLYFSPDAGPQVGPTKGAAAI